MRPIIFRGDRGGIFQPNRLRGRDRLPLVINRTFIRRTELRCIEQINPVVATGDLRSGNILFSRGHGTPCSCRLCEEKAAQTNQTHTC